jgi:hypothetical protein
MSEFFIAYAARLKRNEEALIRLIKDVTTKDPTVEAYIVSRDLNRTIEGVTFIKGDQINQIHFHKVPYRWSGCGYSEHRKYHYGGENYSMPFTAEDVLKTFTPINQERMVTRNFKDKEEYLMWRNYLIKYPYDKV